MDSNKIKIAVIDANYSNTKHLGMAASWLLWELEKSGVTPVNPRMADYILVTVSSQQGISSVRGKLRKIKNKSAKIIIGGGASYAPAVFDKVADVVCVGEGSNFIKTLLRDGYDAARELPESWIPNDTRRVIPSLDFPWSIPPLKHPDGTIRLFASRGCKYKCLFCQTGLETTYRVSPNQSILLSRAARLTQKGSRVAFVTNDGAEESIQLAGQQEFLSVTLKNLKAIMPLTRNNVKGVRIGVEGVSERLRSAVGKKNDNDELLSITADLLKESIGVRWFFIPGLPGEDEYDYEELRYLTMGIKRMIPRGVVMMNFHSFIPMPATPLGVLPLVDKYWERLDEFRRWFFHGPGFTRRIQIVMTNKYPSRLKRSQESMAATEEELRRGWFYDDNKNWRVKYLMSPEKLRNVARRYAERVGLSDVI